MASGGLPLKARPVARPRMVMPPQTPLVRPAARVVFPNLGTTPVPRPMIVQPPPVPLPVRAPQASLPVRAPPASEVDLVCAWVGSIPEDVDEVAAIACIAKLGGTPPWKFLIRSNQPMQGRPGNWGIAHFASEKERDDFLKKRFSWPNGAFAVTRRDSCATTHLQR